ncbi:hypothetical protein BCT04_16815 [Vibrio breoganii]|uniref:sulfotransferase family protein n=1 Tax=Vibrio breoganii TaxID=553239 RepID=UPI000C84474F|nr:sulfotransferase [Vibrio breoganii]PMO62224.1 hypothetical protein BCT04_16815 [Vibrio breoganii]
MHKIYIAGCPRSGTTLLASIIAKNEKIVCTPESQFKFEFFKAKDANLNSKSAKWRLRTWGESFNDEELEKIGDYNTAMQYLVVKYSRLNNLNVDIDKLIWLDHTPSNGLFSEELLNNDKNSQMIFIIRDPRAVFQSVIKLPWGARSAKELVKIWMQYLSIACLAKEKYPERVMIIRYEDLVLSKEDTLFKISKFVGFDFKGSNTAYKVPMHSKKQHSLIGKEISKERVESWKQDINSLDAMYIEEQCKSQLLLLDYEIHGFKKIRMSDYIDRCLTSINNNIGLYYTRFIRRL